MDPVPTPAQPVTREMVLDARLPSAVSSERAEARRIRILAGQAAGRDVHNGPALGSILEGSVLFQVERRDEARSFAGDVFFEPAGVPVGRGGLVPRLPVRVVGERGGECPG